MQPIPYQFYTHILLMSFQSIFGTLRKKMYPKCHSSPTLIYSTEETFDRNKQKLHDQEKYTSALILKLRTQIYT